MFAPGDVVGFFSILAEKFKYHVCIGGSPCRFLLVNSVSRPGNFQIKHSDCPALPKTFSFVNCSVIIAAASQTLKEQRAKRIGQLPPAVYKRLVTHLSNSPELSAADKRKIVADAEPRDA